MSKFWRLKVTGNVCLIRASAEHLNDFHLLICSVIQSLTPKNALKQIRFLPIRLPQTWFLVHHCAFTVWQEKWTFWLLLVPCFDFFFNINYKFHLFLTFVQTTSNNIQAIVESRIEKRTKAEFVPVGGKRLLCFLDDLNMPAQDLFGSQPPLELLRLWIDYGFWYDRQKQTQMFIKVREKISLWIQGKFSLFSFRFFTSVLFCTWVKSCETTCVFSCRTCCCWHLWGPLVEGGLTFLSAYRVVSTSSIWPSLMCAAMSLCFSLTLTTVMLLGDVFILNMICDKIQYDINTGITVSFSTILLSGVIYLMPDCVKWI